MCNFMHGTTHHAYDKNLDFVLDWLEQQSSTALKWFEDDYESEFWLM